jgi:diguanylate cyclase
MTAELEKHHATKWSRQALERLERDVLLPTPRNYMVYYHYFAGDIQPLNADYDTIIANGKITQYQCNELYEKYIVADRELLLARNASGVVDTEIKKVMQILDTSIKGAERFGSNLSDFSGQVTNAKSLDVLRGAIENIVAETRAVAVQNQNLREELHMTSAKLDEVQKDFEKVYKEAQLDPLTKVGNRKMFEKEMTRVVLEARQHPHVLSLLMIDIDHFKKFNDAHGHLIGDQVLRLVAKTLVENLKGRDIIARYGGEEFVILLPQTRLQDAERVANLLRASLATKQIRKRNSNEVLGAVTISIGAAELAGTEDSDTFIARADAALYQAKQTGRNKVVCAQQEG